MVQIVEQTREEKMQMYLKLSKRELAEMLINCNDILQSIPPRVTISSHFSTPCYHQMEWVQHYSSTGGGYYQCTKCGYSQRQAMFTSGSSNNFHSNIH